MVRILTAILIGVCTAVVVHAQTLDKATQEDKSMLKAVIHVNFGDVERQEKGLENIKNILLEAEDAQIEVVCHGEGIILVVKKQAKHSELVEALMKKGVRFVACENTMKKKSLRKEDLVTGTTTVPSGAVEVIRKQSQGYGYFRP